MLTNPPVPWWTYVGPVEAEDGRAECTPHVALGGVRVVQEAHLERDEAVRAQVDALHEGVLLPVPEVQEAPVVACGGQSRQSHTHQSTPATV